MSATGAKRCLFVVASTSESLQLIDVCDARVPIPGNKLDDQPGAVGQVLCRAVQHVVREVGTDCLLVDEGTNIPDYVADGSYVQTLNARVQHVQLRHSS